MWVLLGAYDSEEPDHANHYDYRSRYREVGFSSPWRWCEWRCCCSPSIEAAVCAVVLSEAASVPYWSRELQALGHTVRLMPPAYVKPYVKRQKNDAADAEAICEAVTRPNMRFVPTKTPEQQSCASSHPASLHSPADGSHQFNPRPSR